MSKALDNLPFQTFKFLRRIFGSSNYMLLQSNRQFCSKLSQRFVLNAFSTTNIRRHFGFLFRRIK